MEFHANRLLVNNFQESLTFYRDILGFSGWHNDEQEYAYFEEKQLALLTHKRMSVLLGEANETTTLTSSHFVLQFEVEDVDAVFHMLQARGVHFIVAPTDMVAWGSRVAHFRDPDGNVIELYKSIR